MSYHYLSSCTLDAGERREEANRIYSMIEHYWTQMTDPEREFVSRCSDSHYPISVKQLFWLRDIKDKYL